MKKVLVLGGTGFVGRSFLRLLPQNFEAVVPTRGVTDFAGEVTSRVKYVRGANVHDEATLRELCRDVDAVVNLVAILNGTEEQFQRCHRDLPMKLADAMGKEGKRRLVHVSAIGVSANAPSMYLRSKAAGEATLQTSDRRLDLTILRPSVIFGREDKFTNMFSALQRFVPILPLAGRNSLFQPVWVDDVAQAIVKSLELTSAGKTFEVVGPHVMSLGEIVSCVGKIAGHERWQVGLPEWIAYYQAWFMEFLPGEPLLSRDNVASMRVPNVASGRLPGLQDLGIAPSSLADIAPQYLLKQA